MSGATTAPGPARRDLIGGFVLVAVFALMVLVGHGLLVRVGVFPSTDVYRTGIAEVHDCRPSLRWAGWVQTCSATVAWQPPAQWRPGVELTGASTVDVISDRPVAGRVTVESHRMPRLLGRGGAGGSELIIVQGKVVAGSGWWWLPVVIAPFLASIVATIAFHRSWNLLAGRGRRPSGPLR